MRDFCSRLAFMAFFLSHLLLLSSAFSQQITVAFKSEYGSYKMNDLHDLQVYESANIFDSLRTKPKEVYGFPAYWGGQVRVGYSLKRHNFFFNAGHSSTGGRLHYEDYSGVIKIDKIVNSSFGGVGYTYTILNKEKLKLTSGLTMGVANSVLKVDNRVEIYVSEEKSVFSDRYSSHQSYITPEARLQYFPLKFIFIEASVGYFVQIQSTAQKNGYESTLTGKRKNNIDLNWQGFRLGAGIGFRFNLVK